jgi:hypothetical protein
MKKALVTGIDHYTANPLRGCVNDAQAIAGILEKNGDGSPNFCMRLHTSDKEKITSALLNNKKISELFRGDADVVLVHTYYAAVESKACKLTALGAHYRKRAVMNRIL